MGGGAWLFLVDSVGGGTWLFLVDSVGGGAWLFLVDSVGSGTWPFLVGGVICLVNSDNERDSSLLNSSPIPYVGTNFLVGQVAHSHARLSNDRAVMPLDVPGWMHARYTE